MSLMDWSYSHDAKVFLGCCFVFAKVLWVLQGCFEWLLGGLNGPSQNSPVSSLHGNVHTFLDLNGKLYANLFKPTMHETNAISWLICMYFTRWLILYNLSRPQWRVGLGAGLGVDHSYEFIPIVKLEKYLWFSKKKHKFVRARSNEFVRISNLVKYVRIAVRSGWWDFSNGCFSWVQYQNLNIYHRQRRNKWKRWHVHCLLHGYCDHYR